MTPRIEINLAKIAHNASKLLQLFGAKGIDIMGVTKVVCGNSMIAEVLIDSGIHMLADSKLENLKKMRDAGIHAQFILLRTPGLSEVESVIRYADISMNTELSTIQCLSATAMKYDTQHQIILMVEMGDLREGIMPADVKGFVRETMMLPGIQIVGIGASFACFGGVMPSEKKMKQLSLLSSIIETEFSLSLPYVSGGNSANYNWFASTESVGNINNLRLGESIYLGCEPLERIPIPGLYTDAFTFVSEVIEAKLKPSKPYGETGQDAFGNHPRFMDKGYMRRGILGVGSQDVLVAGLSPEIDVEILGSSSDHTLLDLKQTHLKVGDEVRFSLNYGALLSAMSSPYVSKEYHGTLSESHEDPRPTEEKSKQKPISKNLDIRTHCGLK
ncbi:alanine/ornithine racemase family PLP-dependent enzyme [Paenibacillus agricola]|uniref:Alanine/ornithine racemase family PLP-dependent enzyme n=1 Tax=Paenibacillus agricola TaxID=2716264 RepID=A0ABX0J9X0_9BACL|nr:alanine/ornithine racemase family PLP-dependent enzyme [Paenibacillus agricola]NHN33247.1 alanine/ornithine racemase family PLP-dependent enzyme [Paenibacillus agricola]